MILPPLPYLLAGTALIAALAGSAGGWLARSVIADRDIAELQSSIAQERQRHAQASQAAEAKAREIEQARVTSIERIEREAFTRNQAIKADAAAANDASRRLREHIARIASGSAATIDSTVADSSPATAGPGLLFAELFSRIDARAGELATFADNAHAAGLACQNAYNALR